MEKQENGENGSEGLFASDETPDAAPQEKWKILVVDDEEDVHTVTRMVLEDFEFRDKVLEFFHAYSGEEAIELLEEHPDTAVVLLDVVMETEHAGLDAVKRIRNELSNRFVRIILRTGQPGQAPEKEVVVDYDINDYKAKTELTAQKLYTSLISALRSYTDIISLEKNRRGLFKILESAAVFDFNSFSRYASGLLTQFSALLDIDENEIVIVRRNKHSGTPEGCFEIIAAAGRNDRLIGEDIAHALPEQAVSRILKAFQDASGSYDPDGAAYYFDTLPHGAVVVALSRRKVLDEVDIALADIFCQKILLAIANFERLNRMRNDRISGVFGLALLAEPAELTGRGELEKMRLLCDSLSRRLLQTYAFPQEIDDDFVENIGIACVLHDVGNIEMPVELLLKPEKLSTAEMDTLAAHTRQGAKILARMSDGNTQGYLAMAGDIAAGHHEHFNGNGYPEGLKGAGIPLAARIVAVVDSYVAMTTCRPYRGALQPDEAMSRIKQASGERFDPRVVDAFEEIAADFA